MYVYIGEILRNLCNRNFPQKSAGSPRLCLCGVVISLFTYLFGWFIPMNCAS